MSFNRDFEINKLMEAQFKVTSRGFMNTVITVEKPCVSNGRGGGFMISYKKHLQAEDIKEGLADRTIEAFNKFEEFFKVNFEQVLITPYPGYPPW